MAIIACVVLRRRRTVAARGSWRSCTRPFAVIGIAIEQGKIKGVDERVLTLFPGPKATENVDDRKHASTKPRRPLAHSARRYGMARCSLSDRSKDDIF